MVAAVVALAAVGLLVSVGVVVVQRVAPNVGWSLPSDDELIGAFTEHESQFAALVESDGTVSRPSSTQLRRLGIEIERVERDGPDLLYLVVSAIGMVPSGFEKGYVYSVQTPRRTTEGDLESYSGDTDNSPVYRHVKGNWYIYYESW